MNISGVLPIVLVILASEGLDESRINRIERYSKLKRPDMPTIGDMWTIELGYSNTTYCDSGPTVITVDDATGKTEYIQGL